MAEKIKIFNENGKPTVEGQRIISDGVYLAEMAYENKNGLDNLSKPLNKDFPEDPLKSKDSYTIIKNPKTNTKFEVVRIFSDSNTRLNVTTFL